MGNPIHFRDICSYCIIYPQSDRDGQMDRDYQQYIMIFVGISSGFSVMPFPMFCQFYSRR